MRASCRQEELHMQRCRNGAEDGVPTACGYGCLVDEASGVYVVAEVWGECLEVGIWKRRVISDVLLHCAKWGNRKFRKVKWSDPCCVWLCLLERIFKTICFVLNFYLLKSSKGSGSLTIWRTGGAYGSSREQTLVYYPGYGLFWAVSSKRAPESPKERGNNFFFTTVTIGGESLGISKTRYTSDSLERHTLIV